MSATAQQFGWRAKRISSLSALQKTAMRTVTRALPYKEEGNVWAWSFETTSMAIISWHIYIYIFFFGKTLLRKG